MKDHTVIIGSPGSHAEQFFERLCKQLSQVPEMQETQIQLLTNSFEGPLPQSLINLGVIHNVGTGVTDHELEMVNISLAKHVIVIADHDTDPASDCKTLDILGRLHDLDFKGTSVVECVNDANRQRARRLGADAIVRPARGYPEMLIRALVAPGSEAILENFFDTEGDEVHRVELSESVDRSWREIAFAIIGDGVGIPVGFQDSDGQIVTNPPPSLHVDSKVLFVVIGDQQVHPKQAVEACLSVRFTQQAA